MVQNDKEVPVGNMSVAPALLAPDMALQHIPLFTDNDMKFFEKLGEGVNL